MADEIFDPEIHATDKEGNPSLNKDGSFRKKRKDAGGRKPAASASASGARSSGSGGPAREKYRRSVDQVLQIPVTVVSLADPVLGYAGGMLAPMWSNALADLAVENPRLAAALDRAGNLGAMGGLVGAALVTFVQFGHLMGRVPEDMARMMGAKSREEIEQALAARGVQLAERKQTEMTEDQAEAEERAEAEAIRRMMNEGAAQHVAV